MYELYVGYSAHSQFRLENLQSSIQKKTGISTSIQSCWLYYLDITEPLTELEKIKLFALLSIDAEANKRLLETEERIVIPRVGTISPWSTKATEILQRSGLLKVRRVERGILYTCSCIENSQLKAILPFLYDRMTQMVLENRQQGYTLFELQTPKPLSVVDIMSDGIGALQKANEQYGWALSQQEMDYLFQYFQSVKRNPTDAELMMFAQANSEHCRHKIFKATWTIDGLEMPHSLFQMIQNTYEHAPFGILSAYKDNASVIAGPTVERFFPNEHKIYKMVCEPVHTLMKVETHNHPTAISPHPGAATGAGGEIRDEGATGRGSKPKAGLSGFTVSHLQFPDLLSEKAAQPWLTSCGYPSHISTSLNIMLEAPIGAASYNNEFGRPNITGYFRSYEQPLPDGRVAGYHKPIMIAGGLGNIRAEHVEKLPIPPGSAILVLGGPSMKIGLGGGAASSISAGPRQSDLDFASVQRDNPEMQRRAQEVIDTCWALGDKNPILAIHDVGAGGLCNALPELVHDSAVGGYFELRNILNDEPGMTPMEVWCNESQERYVLAVALEDVPYMEAIAARERCPMAVVGYATKDQHLSVNDQHFKNKTVDVPLEWLFGNPPKTHRTVERLQTEGLQAIDLHQISLEEAVERVLRHPTVADKTFLVTIGDRSVTGLITRDQMVGPWQVPVSDVAVTANSYFSNTGEAMAMGERPPLALINPAASSRMALGEAITNITAAKIDQLKNIRLSGNWMAACGEVGQDAALYDAVAAIGIEVCPLLELAIPVGKDSLSMRTKWTDEKRSHTVFSPVSCIMTAFAPVSDVRQTLTPLLQCDKGPTRLLLIDLGQRKHRLGGSIYAEVTQQIGDTCPDLDNPTLLSSFFNAIQFLNAEALILAYHDRSDGGLWATLAEMGFASHKGFTVDLTQVGSSSLTEILFSEELGAVIQVLESDLPTIWDILRAHQLEYLTFDIGAPHSKELFTVQFQGKEVLSLPRTQCHEWWSAVSYQMQRLRDEPSGALSAYQTTIKSGSEGLQNIHSSVKVIQERAPVILQGLKPKVAILREQGVNGHTEMAVAFSLAGFESVDVHMSDLLEGRVRLSDYQGLVACGGFSFGDVLGAGTGWAASILYHAELQKQFHQFFHRTNTFALGVCNGCQMVSQLKDCIPGADHWPRFVRNRSEQFEARLVKVEMMDSPSILFRGMAGSHLPIVVAHGEGLVQFQNEAQRLSAAPYVAMRYVDGVGQPTEQYPENPNGSIGGITGLTTVDGRVTILMPHPERVIKTSRLSWHPRSWPEWSPWMQVFDNAREWVD